MTEVLNVDCMEYMRSLPDKAFDLAIVDPPYGGGCLAPQGTRFKRYEPMPIEYSGQTDRQNRFGGWFDRYRPDITAKRTGGTWSAKKGYNKVAEWDVAPSDEYFDELFRVSKNQIVWGANYFGLPPTRCFVVWRKLTISEKFSMAMAEYAWTSFNRNALVFEAAPQGTPDDPRIHPTQKPVELYEFLLNSFAEKGDRILDTHLGSGSSRIACDELGFDFVGTEIDPQYFAMHEERWKKHKRQLRLFEEG